MGNRQMTTDTAVRCVKMILEDKIPMDDVSNRWCRTLLFIDMPIALPCTMYYDAPISLFKIGQGAWNGLV